MHYKIMANRSSHGNNIHGSNEKKKGFIVIPKMYYYNVVKPSNMGVMLCPVLPTDKLKIFLLNLPTLANSNS